jgi:chromosome partitioning protein
MAKIIAIVNQKGGVGKTTSTVNITTAISTNNKVLVIDLDPQGNTSSGFGILQRFRKITIYDILIGLFNIDQAIIKTNIPNLHLISSNANLSAVEIDLIYMHKREYILRNLIELISHNYDYIFIDCPPSLSLLTINALVACDQLLIPMQCDFYSLEGLSHLLKTISIIEKKLNPKIKICGILFTMFDIRNKLTEYVARDVRNHLKNLVFKTVIPRNVKLSEAPSHGKPGIIYDHKCAGAQAYIEVAKELLERLSL